ncbi:hypothetical protein [Chryseobacterium indoltheticum]|uniref:hypothetical protein n=1 Tax=Chryseobacterium indoltheticum TaxID=254 RepID=UPI003F4981A1
MQEKVFIGTNLVRWNTAVNVINQMLQHNYNFTITNDYLYQIPLSPDKQVAGYEQNP